MGRSYFVNTHKMAHHHVTPIDLYLHGTLVSDEQIIHLNNLLLTPGTHTIIVQDIETGRTMLDTFLLSLNYYHRVAFLSLSPHQCPPHTDLYTTLLEKGYLDATGKLHKDMEDFFIEENFDFIWIEEQHALEQNTWYPIVHRTLQSLNIDREAPIIILRYH